VDDSKAPVKVPADPKLPTLFIVGDSTVNSSAPLRGWGTELPAFFDTSKINVVNRAIGGRSSRTFITEGRWDKVLAEMKRGDFVLIQFGHNDVGKYDDPAAKGRPSLKGEGDDTAEVTKPDGSKETVHTFGWYMRKYCTDAEAKGVSVILCSMVPHKNWNGDKISRAEQATFVKWTADAAKATDAQFIDLNEVIAEGFEKAGKEKVDTFFGDARTHSTPAGAKFNATCVIAALKTLDPDPLDKYFSPAGQAVPKFEKP
jgi:lysophospholipase L1-like esterase